MFVSKVVARLIDWRFGTYMKVARRMVFIQVMRIIILQMPNKLYA